MSETHMAVPATAPTPPLHGEGTSGEQRFVEALPLINSVIDLICRRKCLPDGDDDEFRSVSMMKLIENDYEVLRRFAGRSSLRTYLMIVLQRVLLDYRVREWGKWRPSVEARRCGPLAVRLEQLTVRDGMTVDEAIVSLRTNHRVAESADTLRAIAARLPIRFRTRMESTDALANAIDRGPQPDAIVERAESRAGAASMRAALRAALSSLPASDRVILKLRYVDGLAIVEIARLLQTDARPLYRRVERILSSLRERLREHGVDREFARDLLEGLRIA